jgi:phage head maturation protease
MPRIAGLAAVYDRIAYVRNDPDHGDHFERVCRGAFDRVLRSGRNIFVCWEHDRAQVLGCTEDGSTRVWSGEAGLYFSVDVSERARVLYLLRGGHGGLGASFQFYALKTSTRWARTSSGAPLLELVDVDIWEAGPVTDPAFRCTRVRELFGRSLKVA